MIVGIGSGDGRILIGMGFEIKLAAIHYYATQTGTMTAQEFGGRVHHHIDAMLDGSNQVGSAEGIVDNKEDAMTVSDFCHTLQVGDITIRIAESLAIHHLGVRSYSLLKSIEVIEIDYGMVDTAAT